MRQGLVKQENSKNKCQQGMLLVSSWWDPTGFCFLAGAVLFCTAISNFEVNK